MKRYIKVPIETDVTGEFCHMICDSLYRWDRGHNTTCLRFEVPLKQKNRTTFIRCQQCIDAEVSEAEIAELKTEIVRLKKQIDHMANDAAYKL